MITLERPINCDWKFQRFGVSVEKSGRSDNEQTPKMYFGAKLEEMGLVREGAHLDVHAVDVDAKDGTKRQYDVIPIVWPSYVKPEEPKITLFIPIE